MAKYRKPLFIRLTDEERARIDAVAEEDGLTPNKWAAAAIFDKLAAREDINQWVAKTNKERKA